MQNIKETGGSLVWLRDDLRLEDNHALDAALACPSGIPPLVLYILESPFPGRTPGSASRWWLHHSLAALGKSFQTRWGIPLSFAKGNSQEILEDLIVHGGISSVHWNRRYEGGCRNWDAAIKSKLTSLGAKVTSHTGNLLLEPWRNLKADGTPYKIFTPFWKSLQQREDLIEAPVAMSALSRNRPWIAGNEQPAKSLQFCQLDDLRLLETQGWSKKFASHWEPGEKKAKEQTNFFLQKLLGGYDQKRDIPSLGATSRLSPHLRFGEISPRWLCREVLSAAGTESIKSLGPSAKRFVAELAWREFAHNLLFHYPMVHEIPLREEFKNFPWEHSAEQLHNLHMWQRGETGFPLVDAGMRELWATGWMHNRARMVSASFLVKDLLMDWRLGEQYFWDTLVDACPANNPVSWQWVAGCGTDAAPFFRIFNPQTQGQKFDPEGGYIKQWLPQLQGFSASSIHKMEKETGLKPLVVHEQRRQWALAAYQKLGRKF